MTVQDTPDPSPAGYNQSNLRLDEFTLRDTPLRSRMPRRPRNWSSRILISSGWDLNGRSRRLPESRSNRSTDEQGAQDRTWQSHLIETSPQGDCPSTILELKGFAVRPCGPPLTGETSFPRNGSKGQPSRKAPVNSRKRPAVGCRPEVGVQRALDAPRWRRDPSLPGGGSRRCSKTPAIEGGPYVRRTRPAPQRPTQSDAPVSGRP
jgi:hypothetical protein